MKMIAILARRCARIFCPSQDPKSIIAFAATPPVRRTPAGAVSHHRHLPLVVGMLCWFAAGLPSEATHPRIPAGEFTGVVTAINSKSVTVKGPRGSRVFAIKMGAFDFETGPGYAGLGNRSVTRTQINSNIAPKLHPANVFKVGDRVNVTYWPTLNQGREAGDIQYSDLEKFRAWNKANERHFVTE